MTFLSLLLTIRFVTIATHSVNSAYDDEDLRELQASMERLLQQQRSDDEDDEICGDGHHDEDEHAGLNGQDECSPVEEDSNSIANENEGVSPEEEAGGLASSGHYGAGDAEQLNEEWQSGSMKCIMLFQCIII